MSAPIDITGQRFGKLVALRPTEERRNKQVMWECRCDCGKTVRVKCINLRTGNTRSCGCLRKHINEKHGLSHKERLYGLWNGIKERCRQPGHKLYYRYGGRGIKICDEWANDYAAFREWALSNGYAEGMEIHRLDNDGNYEPSNCVWLTASEHRKLHAELRRQQKTE